MLKIIYFILPLLRNSKLPICSNCIHFLEDKNNYPYDGIPNDYSYGKCKQFGEINVVTGEINYDFVKICRQDITKCGLNGALYENKKKSSIK